jgi:hypothetical protein
MESTGLPRAIQMSYRVVKYLSNPDKFNIITRGRIAVKGKVGLLHARTALKAQPYRQPFDGTCACRGP